MITRDEEFKFIAFVTACCFVMGVILFLLKLKEIGL